MTEEVTAGGKEFLLTVLSAAILYLVCGIIMSAFSNYFAIGGVISLMIFATFGFYILTRYTARFTYSLKNGSLRINRMIGKRNKEIEFDCGKIVSLCYGGKPSDFPKRPYYMRKSIFGAKKSLYIQYRDKEDKICGTVIEPSQKLRKKIEKERKKRVGND